MDLAHGWTARLLAEIATTPLFFALASALLWRIREKGRRTLLAGFALEAVLVALFCLLTYPRSEPALWGVLGGILNGCNAAVFAGWFFHSYLRAR